MYICIYIYTHMYIKLLSSLPAELGATWTFPVFSQLTSREVYPPRSPANVYGSTVLGTKFEKLSKL